MPILRKSSMQNRVCAMREQTIRQGYPAFPRFRIALAQNLRAALVLLG
jgi:hypothetical protein